MLKGNHELIKNEKSTLKKYKNRLQTIVDPKMSFKDKRKMLIQKVVFIIPLPTPVYHVLS